MRAAAQIVKSLIGSKAKFDGSGIACTYYKLSDTIGIKSYSSARAAFGNFVHQRQLHKHGITPDCWGLSSVEVDFKYDDGHSVKSMVYAFFTEHAEVICDIMDAIPSSCRYEFNSWYIHSREDLMEKVRSVGFEPGDMHSGNFGMLNSEMVAIDIGYYYKPNSSYGLVDNMYEERSA